MEVNVVSQDSMKRNAEGFDCFVIVKSKKVLIFPNNYDITVRDYTSDCSASKTTGLCTCSSGEQFQYHKRSCRKKSIFFERKFFVLSL